MLQVLASNVNWDFLRRKDKCIYKEYLSIQGKMNSFPPFRVVNKFLLGFRGLRDIFSKVKDKRLLLRTPHSEATQ